MLPGEGGGRWGKRPTPFALEGGEMVVRVTQGCLASVACPLVYGGHLSANLCPQVAPVRWVEAAVHLRGQ